MIDMTPPVWHMDWSSVFAAWWVAFSVQRNTFLYQVTLISDRYRYTDWHITMSVWPVYNDRPCLIDGQLSNVITTRHYSLVGLSRVSSSSSFLIIIIIIIIILVVVFCCISYHYVQATKTTRPPAVSYRRQCHAAYRDPLRYSTPDLPLTSLLHVTWHNPSTLVLRHSLPPGPPRC